MHGEGRSRYESVRTLMHWLGVLALVAGAAVGLGVWRWLDGRIEGSSAVLAGLVAGLVAGTVWLVLAALLYLLTEVAAASRATLPPTRRARMFCTSLHRLNGLELSAEHVVRMAQQSRTVKVATASSSQTRLSSRGGRSATWPRGGRSSTWPRPRPRARPRA